MSSVNVYLYGLLVHDVRGLEEFVLNKQRVSFQSVQEESDRHSCGHDQFERVPCT